MNRETAGHPHAGQSMLVAGAPVERASGAMIALHGRGADAADILGLALEVAPPSMAVFAPQAANHTWYPFRFLEPLERNEPFLSSALRIIQDQVAALEELGFDPARIVLLGFSQGACLALEYGARNARRYGAILGFSGGLIGPPGAKFSFPGSMEGTPVFLGCSDVDFHIPKERVEETAAVLTELGADVDLRLYPGMGHTVNQDELDAARKLLSGI